MILNVTVYVLLVLSLAVIVALMVAGGCDEGTVPLRLLPDKADLTHDVLGLVETLVIVSLAPRRN